MNWQEYTEKTKETAVYPYSDATPVHSGAVTYLALGLAGETGETVDLIKKQFRKDFSDNRLNRWLTPEFLAKVRLELGDMFWYAAQLMDKLGLDFEEVLQANLDKLAQRKAEGTLKERRANGGFIVGDVTLSAADRNLLVGGYAISAASLREAQASTRLDGETIEIESAVKPDEVVQPFPARKDFFAALEDLNERDRGLVEGMARLDIDDDLKLYQRDELVDPAERDD